MNLQIEEQKLNALMLDLENDLYKSQTHEGVDLIVNDYQVMARKHLDALGLPENYIETKLARVIADHKKGKGSCGPLAHD